MPMSQTIQQLGIDQMSADDRLRLIGEIWDSLSPSERGAIPESHREEIDRRLAAADKDPTAALAWEEVRERLRSGQ
jgi:putative addiction module component (TIGR02574 family)